MRDTLTLSEHLLGIAIFTAPVQWMTGNAVLVYNLAHLASTVLAGFGTYVLTRSLWGRRDAAWLGALAYLRMRHSYGLHRTAGEMTMYSAVAGDYLRIPSGLWVWTGHLPVGEAGRGLYPGVIVTVLAVIGILSGLKSTAAAGESRRRDGGGTSRSTPPSPAWVSG